MIKLYKMKRIFNVFNKKKSLESDLEKAVLDFKMNLNNLLQENKNIKISSIERYFYQDLLATLITRKKPVVLIFRRSQKDYLIQNYSTFDNFQILLKRILNEIKELGSFYKKVELVLESGNTFLIMYRCYFEEGDKSYDDFSSFITPTSINDEEYDLTGTDGHKISFNQN